MTSVAASPLSADQIVEVLANVGPAVRRRLERIGITDAGHLTGRDRIDGLSEPYAAAANAFERYLLYYGGVTDGETVVTMLGDLADLWERAAVDRTPVHQIVGDDPVEFAETFAQSYLGTRWIDKERARLATAIQAAVREGPK